MTVYFKSNNRTSSKYSNNELMQERERIKGEIMREGQSFKVLAACIRVYGPEGGVMVHHMLYLEGHGKDPAGWIYKTEDEWTEEKGLTRHYQRRGRKRLKGAGVWEEEKRGVPARNWYRLDLNKLLEDIAPYLDSEGDVASSECDDSEATIDTSQEGQVKSPGKRGNYRRPTITKEDPKVTTVESKGDGSHPENDFEEHEEAHDTVRKDAPSSREPVTLVTKDRTLTVEDILVIFDKKFEKYGIDPLTKYERLRYQREITALIRDKSADEPEMVRVLLRVIHRQAADENSFRLSPLEAYKDEIAGKPMPPEPTVVCEVRFKERIEERDRSIAESARERAAAHAEDEDGENPY